MSRLEFSKSTKAQAFLRSNGHCECCGAKLSSGNIEYDHSIACGLGGDNSLDNCVVLCKTCHKAKTTKRDVPTIAKAKRQQAANIGAKTSKKPMPFGRKSKWKRKMDGTIIPR